MPDPVRHYLFHTETGLSIRAIAREAGCHASTILRQVRRFEQRRDDPLVDEALRHLWSRDGVRAHKKGQEAPRTMSIQLQQTKAGPCGLDDESLRALKRLCETGAVLAIAKDMPKAVVVRVGPDGSSTRTAVIEREVAHVLVLRDLITATEAKGKIMRYQITAAGRSALKETLDGQPAAGFAEAPTRFDAKNDDGEPGVRRLHYNLAESPLAGLARRRDKDGKPFLNDALVRVGERLREDFELAQMGPRTTQSWESFLTSGARSGSGPAEATGTGAAAARVRVEDALAFLGPGLGDVALRCCCYLEGLESAEKRMGWSARSGKIVLRIALQRLQQHYETSYGKLAPMIG